MDLQKIYDYLKENQKQKRFMHTMGVVATAKKLAKLNGVDTEKAEMAALLHDVCKNMSDDELYKLIEENNVELTIVEKNTPALWHSIAGPILAKEKFNINDEEILGAMRWHTTGKKGMSKLEKIIFISDLIEPSRVFDGIEDIRKEVLLDLDTGVLKGIDQTIIYLISLGGLIDDKIIEFRNDLILNQK